MATRTKGVRLDEEEIDRLERVSASQDRDVSYYIKIAVRRFMDSQEFKELEAIVQERDAVLAGTVELVSHADAIAGAQAWTNPST